MEQQIKILINKLKIIIEDNKKDKEKKVKMKVEEELKKENNKNVLVVEDGYQFEI